MSPEQVLGKGVDDRTDLFSLGLVLYEATTGQRPFGAGPWMEWSQRVVHHPPDPLHRWNPELPAELERIILKCLQKEPDRRYQSARELRVGLPNLRATRSGEAGSNLTVLVCVEFPAVKELKEEGRLQEAAAALRAAHARVEVARQGKGQPAACVGETVVLCFGRPSDAVECGLRIQTTEGPSRRMTLHLGVVGRPEESH